MARPRSFFPDPKLKPQAPTPRCGLRNGSVSRPRPCTFSSSLRRPAANATLSNALTSFQRFPHQNFFIFLISFPRPSPLIRWSALDQHPSHGNCARAHASARWVAKPTPERAERPGIRPHGRVPLLLWGTLRRPGSHRLLPSIPKGGKCMWRLLQAGQVQTLALGPRVVPGFRRTQTISARCVRAATAKKRIARGVDTAVVSPCHRIR